MAEQRTWAKPHERIDDLQRKGLRIIQDPKAFRFGSDAVLLAAFAQGVADERVLDLGTGTGILPLLLWGRYGHRHVTAVEIQPDMADMARRSMSMNGLDAVINVVCSDYTHMDVYALGAPFDLVISNPPYIPLGNDAELDTDSARICARHEVHATLQQTVAVASQSLRPQGRFCLVHKPHRLPEIFVAMHACALAPRRMRFVQPWADQPPNMVLVEAIKQGQCELQPEPALCIYKPDGSFTAEVEHIYNEEAE